MDPMLIAIILVVIVVLVYGAKKLITSEDHKNDRTDTERDNNTDAGIQEVKSKRET